MKSSKKFRGLIIVAMVLALLVGSAFADEKLYTSESFKIPKDRIEQPEEASENGEAIPEEAREESALPEEAEESLSQQEEIPAEGEDAVADESEAETADAEVMDTEEAEESAEPEVLPPELRTVVITSSRGEHVTAGEPIYLEAHLQGFGDLPVTYRWQVDKNDGMGWQDVGSNRNYHVFIASEETVLYSWRLLVEVEE